MKEGIAMKILRIYAPSAGRCLYAALLVMLALTMSGCGGGGGGGGSSTDGGTTPVVPAQNSAFVVMAWNDLGMHCLNPTYDTAVVLPPYNTIHAQVIRRGDPPQVVTSGLTVQYAVVNNTYSYGKRSYGQFWDFMLQLFGVTLAHDTGLNLVDAGVHNSLSGTMVAKTGYFSADGIPLTPVDDSNVWNPYQVVQITVKDGSGATVAQTRATIPTSDEINCGKCHGANAFQDVLTRHDARHGTNLSGSKPVLCASCHGSPVLGGTGTGSAGIYLSQAIHGFHSTVNPAPSCYDCHPGTTTQCSRSLAHTAADGNCTACHGSLATVASSIASAQRVPWTVEPKCVTCHPGVAQVDTGTVLYRGATGHGNLNCEACHGSPHAMVPTSQASDNYQAIQYQAKAKSIASCGVCHSGSRGEGSSGFASQHGGTNPRRTTACNVCHTAVSATTANWPHAFQWKNR
jgi:hypothetical protein